ncbi:MAG: NUDIX hydrolase [SAR324 cluster bacterium]|nr:NUDIX hydrolase [SAR324 cluster bacterium]
MSVRSREAATLVLMRDRGGVGGTPEVLMAQRHPRDAFAAGAFVFPGGVLEETDHAPAAVAASPELSPRQAHESMESVKSPERALGFYIAAIRETFEEVGVLLTKPNGEGPRQNEPEEAGQSKAARDAMRRGELSFVEWLSGRGLRPATEDLVYFAHWITPEARPKRFDTRFFLADGSANHAIAPDQAEIVECRWITPREAIVAHRAEKMRMVGATVKNLELLTLFGSTQQALRELRNREVRPVMPKLVPLDNGSFRAVMPWDADYDSV